MARIRIKTEKIERERKMQGVTKQSLANFCGVHRNTYAYMLKTKKASIETAYKLCEALNLTLAEIVR